MPRGRLLLIAALVLTGLTAAPASAAAGPDCRVPYMNGDVILRDSKPLDLWLNCTDADPPGDDFALEVSDPPTHGTVGTPVWDPTIKTFVLPYDPHDGYLGRDQLTLTASDESGAREQVVDFLIEPNSAPVCSEPNTPSRDAYYWRAGVDDAQSTILECVDLDLQDWYDLDSGVNTQPEHGTLVVESYTDDHSMINLSVSYTPDPGFTGDDTFVVAMSDGQYADLLTFHVTVADGLWCTDTDPLELRAGQTATSYTLCSDPDFGSHTIEVVDAPSKGTTTVEGQRIHYTAYAEAGGLDSFSYRATSPTGDSNVVTQLVEVVPNAAPVCEPMNRLVTSGSAPTFALRCADPEEDEISLAVDRGPEHGSLSEITDGSVTYTPEPGFVGVDRFTYTGSDYARTSMPAAVRITVDDGKAPVLDLHVTRGQSPRAVARNGLAYHLDNDEQVTAALVATISGRTAQRLGLVRRVDGPVRIAWDRSRLDHDTSVLGLLHLRDRAANAIRAARRVTLTLTFTGTDPTGATTTVVRRVTLRR